MNRTLILVFFAFLFSSHVEAAETPEQFFQKFIELGQKFDPAVANLYSDAAKIHSYRVYPHGLERTVELSGLQLKQLMDRIMPVAKAKNDSNLYKKIKINQSGKSFKIKADRYSLLKCYTDEGYYLIIEPDGKGSFLIIEEYLETQPQSNC